MSMQRWEMLSRAVAQQTACRLKASGTVQQQLQRQLCWPACGAQHLGAPYKSQQRPCALHRRHSTQCRNGRQAISSRLVVAELLSVSQSSQDMRLLAAESMRSQLGNTMHSSHQAADKQAAYMRSLALMRTCTMQPARVLGPHSNQLRLLRIFLWHVSSCTRVVRLPSWESLRTSRGTVWQLQ